LLDLPPLAGAMMTAAIIWGVFPFMRAFEYGNIAGAAVCWGFFFGIAAWIWPSDVPAWGLLIFPAATVTASLVPDLLIGRQAVPLLRTQEQALAVAHVARLGHELVVVALLAIVGSLPVAVLGQWPPSMGSLAAAVAALGAVAAALTFGARSYRVNFKRQKDCPSLRVAAIAVDPPPRVGSMFAAMSQNELMAAVARYEPRVAEAASKGARLIVLPEMAVVVTARDAERWLTQLSEWAKSAQATIVANHFDADQRRNLLVIIDETGKVITTYDKQHPVPGIEPKPPTKMPPAYHHGAIPVSGVTCYDLDYMTWVREVSRRGGVLAVPANDWQEVADMHHGVTRWAAILGAVPVVRATTHGISSVFDAAGRTVSRASSFDGPVVLVADVPVIAKLGVLMPIVGEPEPVLNRRNSPLNSRAQFSDGSGRRFFAVCGNICAWNSTRYDRSEPSSGSRGRMPKDTSG
jgi:predicted amidohydrolase